MNAVLDRSVEVCRCAVRNAKNVAFLIVCGALATAISSTAADLPHKDIKPYRAFYYDGSGKLVNAETLDDVSIRQLRKHRKLQPYGMEGAAEDPLQNDMPIKNACPRDEDLQAVDASATFAVYFVYTDLQDGRPHRPQRNHEDLHMLKAYEEVISAQNANQNRSIECVKETVMTPCQFPKACHCMGASCCCW